jgi:hypothetical protein
VVNVLEHRTTPDYPTLMTRAVALVGLLRVQLGSVPGIRVVCSPAALTSAAGFDVVAALVAFSADYDARPHLLDLLPNTNLAYGLQPGTLSSANGGVPPHRVLEGLVRCPFESCIVTSISAQQMAFPGDAIKQLFATVTEPMIGPNGVAPYAVVPAVNFDLSTPSDWTDLRFAAFQKAPSSNASTQTRSVWVEELVRIYVAHANRTAFALTELRPAVMETFTRLGTSVTPAYLSQGHAQWPLFARLCTADGPKCAMVYSAPSKGSPVYQSLLQVLTKVGLQASIDRVVSGGLVNEGRDKASWEAGLHMQTSHPSYTSQKNEGGGWRYLHPGTDGLPAKLCWEKAPAAAPASAAAASAQPTNKKLVVLCGDGESSIGAHRDLTLNVSASRPNTSDLTLNVSAGRPNTSDLTLNVSAGRPNTSDLTLNVSASRPNTILRSVYCVLYCVLYCVVYTVYYTV